MDTNDPLPVADVERRKLELEEEKVANEREKIRIERIRSWTGNGSVFGSVLVVAATVCLGIWSQYQQGQLQHQLAERQAKAQFELKAAEIVMSTNDPGVTRNKAKALQALFPHYLSENFASSFVPDDFARPTEIASTTIAAISPRAETRAASPAVIRQADGSVISYEGNRPRVYKARPLRISGDEQPLAPLDVELDPDTAIDDSKMVQAPAIVSSEANGNPMNTVVPAGKGDGGSNANTNTRPVRP